MKAYCDQWPRYSDYFETKHDQAALLWMAIARVRVQLKPDMDLMNVSDGHSADCPLQRNSLIWPMNYEAGALATLRPNAV
jgi:hypothetical protein